GIAGIGPAVTVTGEGTIHVWNSIHGFDPSKDPPSPPDWTFVVAADRAAELFAIWSKTTTAGLPHPGGAAECYGAVYARACANGRGTASRYYEDFQLAPEMTNVWQCFETNVPLMPAAGHPKLYCHFR